MRLVAAVVALIGLATFANGMSQQEIIDIVNSNPRSTWKAGINFQGRDPKSLKHLMGVIQSPFLEQVESDPYTPPRIVGDLPENFDAREQWPDCPSINDIRDQSDCGSCWAFGATEAMSDRICIHSNAQTIVRISPEELMTCCTGVFSCGFGCNGGQPKAAWKYWKNNGLVTGFLYGDTDTCQPYAFPPCAHHINSTDLPPCGNSTYNTPACEQSCIPEYTANSFEDDKHYGASAYTISRDCDAIQAEIYTNGPVEADFNVYEDFLTYTSGVYVHQTGDLLGGHAIKMLGWGVENGQPYWLCANSWNSEWGDQGYFKILRGSNECKIENDINAGIPK